MGHDLAIRRRLIRRMPGRHGGARRRRGGAEPRRLCRRPAIGAAVGRQGRTGGVRGRAIVRAIGGQVWLHTGVVLPHLDGGTAYVADVSQFSIEAVATAAE